MVARRSIPCGRGLPKASASWRSHGGLALVALARIAARVGNDQGNPRAEVARGITSNFSKLATKGSADRRPWAALSLGLFEENTIAAGAPPSLESRVLLRRLLAKAKDPEERSAAGIALGLAGDEESIPLLIQRLTGGESVYAAALALLGANAAIDRLGVIAADEGSLDRPGAPARRLPR